MKKLLFTFYAAISFSFAFSQNVGIGTNSPHPSAALDIADTAKGILIPRMTSFQRNAIQNPAEGLMIYQTDDSTGFWYYSGQKWLQMNSKGLKGDQGEQGIQGVKGDSGISVRATRVNGDSLYITLSNGQTINAGNVRGLTGAQGLQGEQGPQGLQGIQGPQGEQGIQGFLPNGSAVGNTSYWNGTSWVTNNSNIYNNGSSVGINNSNPHASAVLDIQDSTRGILIPRMTMFQRNAIQNPAEGLMVYQSDSTKGYWFYNGDTWKTVTNNTTNNTNNNNQTVNCYNCPTMLSSVSSTTMSVQAAAAYCSSLVESGYSDWRVPTLNEFEYLRDVLNIPAPTVDCWTKDFQIVGNGVQRSWTNPVYVSTSRDIYIGGLINTVCIR